MSNLTHASRALICYMDNRPVPPPGLSNACIPQDGFNPALRHLSYTGHPVTVATGRLSEIDCWRCQRLVFEAIEPVRRDWLLEQGLIRLD